MTPIEAVQDGVAGELENEDGEKVRVLAKPGLPEAEIVAFEKELPGRLPAEIRELLEFTSGLEPGVGPVELVDFRGRTGGFEYTGAFPCSVPVASDGMGNFWVVDVDPDTGAWGTVFYACHDPPVIVVQAESLSVFLQEMFKAGQRNRESHLLQIYGNADMRIWREDPFLMRTDDPTIMNDQGLQAFASALGSSYRIADLRRRQIGSGFSWGRDGPDTDVRRWGKELVFAVEHRERIGFLKRLFRTGKPG
jgi:hypothetical protein